MNKQSWGKTNQNTAKNLHKEQLQTQQSLKVKTESIMNKHMLKMENPSE